MIRNLTTTAVLIGLGAAAVYWWPIEPDVDRKQPNPHFFNERAFPEGAIDLDALSLARFDARELREAEARRGGATWEPRGPNNIQGRVTDIAVDPTDESVAFVATAEGGVFRTLDGGASWDALFDDMPSLSVGAVAVDPSDPNVIYAGTGEVNPGGGSVAYGGTGLYRSVDRGDSWMSIGLENSGSIGRVVVHPSNSDIIHVAVMGHLWKSGPDRGVYRTDNGGATWTAVLHTDVATGCADIVQRPDNPDVLFAAMWRRIRTPYEYDYGGAECGVYTSTNGGVTWSLVGNGLPGPNSDAGRIGLAICQSAPEVMCAIYADRSGDFDGLYRTTNGGTSWSRTNDGSMSSSLYSTYGWWFGNVRIHPQDPLTIYALGFRFFRSTNGGGSYAWTGSSMHVDHHAMAFGSGASPKMYEGNDGGVYTSPDGSSWTKTTGDLPITQAYRIATATWDDDALWIGAQDNGTSVDVSGDGDYSEIYGGDGFQPLPHLTDPSRIWAQSQYGGLGFSSDGGGSFFGATSGLSGRRNWNAPHVHDPTDPEVRYFGTHSVFRNSGNQSWTAVSSDLTGGPYLGNNGQVDGTLTTIAVSQVDGDVIWAGSDDGFVHVTQTAGAAWTDVSASLPERWITSVAPHPSIAAAALVTVSGFRWGEDVAHVYYTDDFGATWSPLDGNLPDAPLNDAWIDPLNVNRFVVVGDVGVFVSMDAGAAWTAFGTGLPNVVVSDLSYNSTTRELFAGTFGRSIFAMSLDDVVGVEPPSAPEVARDLVLPPAPNPTPGRTYFAWSVEHARDVTVDVFAVSGRLVWRSAATPGTVGGVDWDGRDLAGRTVADGVYLVRVKADGRSLGTERLVVRR